MAREVYVKLGGEERRLMYNAARAALLIEDRLQKTPAAVVDEDLSPNKKRPGFSTKALAFLLWLGMKADVPGLKETTVVDWLTESYTAPDGIGGFKLCEHVRDALLLSGVCGFSVDLEAAKEAEAEDGAGDTGKGAPAAPAVKPSESP